MTNPIAIWLALAIVAFLALDHYYLGWDLPVFLGRVLLNAIEALKIWQ